jgi:4-hydroxy-2-oxoheptanedioate aldolase
MPVVPALARRLRAGDQIVCGWVGMPDPLIAESVSRTGFDAVLLEAQHGLHDTGSLMRSIAAIAFAGVPALVRIPVADNATASRVLDMGAEGIVAPMVNSAADARALVAATKYPPVGERSWGPSRAMALRGTQQQQHLEAENATSVIFAMIETREALDAVDQIAAVDGIDGLFLGPNDLSLTLSRGAQLAPSDSSLSGPFGRIAEAARKAGKIPAVYAATPERGRYFRSLGFQFIALGSDQAYLANGAKAMLTAFSA